MHKQDERDMLDSSICGKDLREMVTSKLHTEHRLTLLREPVVSVWFMIFIL